MEEGNTEISDKCIGHIEALHNECYACFPDGKNDQCPIYSPIKAYTTSRPLVQAYEAVVNDKMRLMNNASQSNPRRI